MYTSCHFEIQTSVLAKIHQKQAKKCAQQTPYLWEAKISQKTGNNPSNKIGSSSGTPICAQAAAHQFQFFYFFIDANLHPSRCTPISIFLFFLIKKLCVYTDLVPVPYPASDAPDVADVNTMSSLTCVNTGR